MYGLTPRHTARLCGIKMDGSANVVFWNMFKNINLISQIFSQDKLWQYQKVQEMVHAIN